MRRLAIAVVLVVAAGAVAAIVLRPGSSHKDAAGTTTVTRPTTPARPRRVAHPRPTPAVLAERVTGSLDAPLQDPSFAKSGHAALLLGGLDAADTSVDSVIAAGFHGARTIGRLPSVRHDTAAAALGGTAYVVGGYTGARWLDTIVAFRPGRPARVVAHLPWTLRYAAVTAVRNSLVIAGGSRENGTASNAVLLFRPPTGRVTRLGTLPEPTTHAAAATERGIAYVIGGRGAARGTPSSSIVAIDVGRRHVRAAGALDAPRSDLAAVAVGPRILLAGGSGTSGTTSTVSELAPVRLPAGAALRDAANVYVHDGADQLAPAARRARDLVYVPNSRSDTVDVIDPHTYRIVEHFAVGGLPQHVVPAWDLKRLYVTNDLGNSLTTIDPVTGKPGAVIPVDDPYNMYFTPDGRYAIVVAERLRRLDFRDAHTFRLHHSLAVPCAGVDHIDFSADGTYLLASCEFSGQVLKVDVQSERVVGTLNLPGGSGEMPQDVKLSPDGKVFYVADMRANGLWEIDGEQLKVIGFLHTGIGVHGLYPSRDARYLYATNRGEGSISVISFRTRKVVAKWRIPGGGSPDMGGVSADGRVLWVSGRYNGVVYAISTHNGRLLARIPVGSGPHGLCVWPQPGRYSLGHTGILR